MRALLPILASAGLLGPLALSQTTVNGKAKTVGACSVAHSGNQDIIVIKNCGVGAEQGRKIIELLNKVLLDQDKVSVSAKLDHLIEIASQPKQIVNAPNGIGIGGSNFGTATVNNIGYLPKKINPDTLAEISTLMAPFAGSNDRSGLVTCQLGDSNSCSLAGQLTKMFLNAGWKLAGGGYGQALFSVAPEPLMIAINTTASFQENQQITSNQGLPPGSFELAHALISAGISVHFMLDKNVPEGTFSIIVGTHP